MAMLRRCGIAFALAVLVLTVIVSPAESWRSDQPPQGADTIVPYCPPAPTPCGGYALNQYSVLVTVPGAVQWFGFVGPADYQLAVSGWPFGNTPGLPSGLECGQITTHTPNDTAFCGWENAPASATTLHFTLAVSQGNGAGAPAQLPVGQTVALYSGVNTTAARKVETLLKKLTVSPICDATPQATVSPDLLEFSSHFPGRSVESQIATLTNTGGRCSKLLLNRLLVQTDVGPTATFYPATVTNDCYSKRTSGPLELIPGQSCLVGIAFQAKNPLGYTGSLTFYTNAGDAKVELVGYLELPNGKTGPFDVHYTPRQKERLKIIKHLHAGLAIITGAAGVIVAPLAIPLGILAAAEGGAAEMYDVMSEDPADMNFRQIAHVRMGAVALVKTSASSYAPVENTLLEDVSKVKALTAVLATSINRAQGAAQSHNQTAEVAQLRAAKTYAVDLASALVSESNAEGALWNEVQKQGQPGSFSASQVSAAAKKAAANGLPAGEVAALRKAGLTPAAISALARSVATAHGAANLGTAIADSVSANAEGAAVLLSFAAVQP